MVNKKTILIVEDDEIILEIISYILDECGRYSCLKVINGREALTVLSSSLETSPKIDCILLDQRMPDMNGIEFLREKQKLSEELAKIPVVFVTAHSLSDVPVEASQTNVVVGYIEKPAFEEKVLQYLDRIFVKNELELMIQEFKELCGKQNTAFWQVK